MALWDRLMASTSAAMREWRDYGLAPTISAVQRYSELWSYYDGSWNNAPVMLRQRATQPRLYENTRLLWSIGHATIRPYAQTVYLGPLSTTGEPLPDGTLGAIPIEPQVTGPNADTFNKLLPRTCAELWTMWNWRRYKSLRPKVAAILGDCLTELIDDVEHGKVFPRTIWSGYVTDLELDDAGNVKAYAIEYPVTEEETDAAGKVIRSTTYRYRKAVDGDEFRFFKDDKPFDYSGQGAVQPNFYRFAPAVWDRFEIGWGERGIGALDATWRRARQMNSTLSHAMDYQDKQYAAPIVVKGRIRRNRTGGNQPLVAPRPAPTDDPVADAAANAQLLDLLEVEGDGGGVSSILFDLGQTVATLTFMQDNIFTENPEAQFGQKLREMSQLTGPGAERAMGDIVGTIKDCRDSLDPGTVALHQMSIAMIGERLKRGDYAPDVLTSRHETFQAFSLDSWRRGELDMVIRDRPVIPESEREKVERLILVESLQTPWGMQQAGVPAEEVDAILEKRRADREAFDVDLTGIGGENDDEGEGGAE